MILTIASKELRTLFSSPLAWVILAVLALITSYLFLSQIDAFLTIQPQLAQYANPPGITEVIAAPLFTSTSVIFMMIAPIISMRLISEERRNQTLPLLISAPLSMTEIALGKFLGICLFLAIAIGITLSMTLSLYAGGTLDLKLILANLLGLTLLTGSYAALGLYISSLTANPMIAAVGSLGALLGLWVVDASASDPDSALRYVSLLKHFDAFNRGLIDTADIAYFVLFTATFVVLTIRRLDRDRLRG